MAMGPLKRLKPKGSGSGNRGEEYDDLPALETVPSIGTQAVDTGSSVRVHGGYSNSAARESEEDRISIMHDGDGASLVGNESQRMIIRKDVDIHVQRNEP